MSNEITHNAITGLNLYACRFQADGDVFLTSGASDEVWGTGARDADDYDVALVEEDSSGHYKGDFDTSTNITAAGTYPVTIYRRITGTPVDSDPAIAQGVMYWDGTAEINLSTISIDIDAISAQQSAVTNVYDERGTTTKLGGVYPVVVTDSGGVEP